MTTARHLQAASACHILRHFIPPRQLRTITELTQGEEGEFFIDKLVELSTLVSTMPRVTVREEDVPAQAYLHYFSDGADWWISEIDSESRDPTAPITEQQQAFGYARLFENGGELGYISIAEIIAHPRVELDLYWTPKPISEIQEKHP